MRVKFSRGNILDSIPPLCIIFGCVRFSQALRVVSSVRGFPFMKAFLLSTPAQIVIWTAVLLVLMAVGWYVVRSFRDRISDDQLSANQLLTNFRELHQQGDISDAEFRTIKTVLGEKLQQELKGTDGTG